MKKPEEEAREAHQKNFEEETSTSWIEIPLFILSNLLFLRNRFHENV